MENSKINYNRKEMTREEIARDENFDLLLKKHSQIQLRRRLGVGGMILAGVFLLTTILVYVLDKSKPGIVKNNLEIGNVRGINLPFDFEIESKVFLVENERGGVFKYNNSEINIKANSFVDSNGNLIEGEVKIKYKEFHNPFDFFVSGIPMTYDSANYKYHFESAGMFDIRGFKNEIPVGLVKSMEVKLASKQEGNYFNKYYFNQKNNEWEFISKDEKILISEDFIVSELDEKEIRNELKNIAKKVKKIEGTKPVLKSKNAVCIKIEVDKKEFPELESFKDVLFEIDETDENFNPELAKIEWDDIKLVKKGTGYQLVFFDKFKKTILDAKPVFSAIEFEKAMDNYLAINKSELGKLKMERNKLIQVSKSFSNQTRVSSNIGDYVYRLFEVNNFGIYNSDCPRRMPKGQMISTLFLHKKEGVEKPDTIVIKKMYLVEENKNILYNLGSSSTISFNPQNKYVLWAVTNKNELAVYKAKEFAKIPRNFNGTYNFEMDLTTEKIYSMEQVKKVLDLKTLFNDI